VCDHMYIYIYIHIYIYIRLASDVRPASGCVYFVPAISDPLKTEIYI